MVCPFGREAAADVDSPNSRRSLRLRPTRRMPTIPTTDRMPTSMSVNTISAAETSARAIPKINMVRLRVAGLLSITSL